MKNKALQVHFFVRSAAFAGSLFALGGCEPSDVPVGAEGSAVNLAQCLGPGLDCRSVETRVLSSQPARVCDAAPAGELKLDFLVDLPFQTSRMALGADGSIWILGTLASSQAMLRHYSAEGTLLGEHSFGRAENGLEEADVAGDARGHGFVVRYVQSFSADNKDEFFEHVELQELDPEATPVGASLELVGTANSVLALSPDGGFRIAGNARENGRNGVLTRLTADKEPLWIQNNVRTSGRGVGFGVLGIVVDAAGGSTVLSERESGASNSTFGLAGFDADGHAIWDATLPTEFADGMPAQLVADRLGNLIVAGELVPSPAQIIHSLSAERDASWAWQFDGYSAVAVVPNTGEVVSASHDRVFMIPASGETCNVYSLPPLIINGSEWSWYVNALAAPQPGRIYFMNTSQLGRFSRVDTE